MYRFTHSEDRNVQEQPQKRGHVSGVSRPEIHLCAHSSDLYMGQRPDVPGLAKLPNRPPTPTHAHSHTHTHAQTLSSGIQDRLCGPAHRVLHSSALCPDEGVSDKAQTGEVDPGVQRRRLCVCFSLFFSLFYFQGAKQLSIHTVEQPEYCRFRLHSYEKKKRGFPSYLHTYIHILTILTYLKMTYSV